MLLRRLLFLFFVFIGISANAVAVNPSGALRVEVTTAYNFIVDSNVESPSTYAPRSAYITARIWNDGTSDLTDVTVNVGDGTTAGSYTSVTNPATGQVGTFSLVHEGGSLGSADATRYFSSIPAGDYVPVYWLVSYPNLDDNDESVTRGSKPDDDLVLDYSIWATSGANTAQVDRTAAMRSCISAMANKIFPNGANKVPQEYQDLLQKYEPAWDNSSSDGSPGTSVVTEGIWYDLGNVGKGFDNDGDLVPDQNAWLQPVGDPTLFDPSEFRLANTYALVVVKLKSGGELVYDVKDQLYFDNIPDNNGVIGLVRYDFLPLQSGATAQLTPYQMAASGFDNEKFNGDFGASIGSVQGSESQVTLTKTVDKATAAAADTLTYDIDFSNDGTEPIGDPSITLPLVIQDSIPANTTYNTGSAASGNTLPTGVSGYTIAYSIDNGVTWDSSAEPVPASGVTDLQWWLDDPLPGSENGKVTFAVTIDTPATGVAVIDNTAGLSMGNTIPFLEDSAVTLITGTLEISGVVFLDDGDTGGVYGNGVQDGSEVGIAAVTVSLYYDANNDGLVDVGDTLISTASSAVTTGAYSFPGLPEGNYLVLVDQNDTEVTLPSYSPTSATLLDVTLSGGNSIGNDYGFAPTLQVFKTGTLTAKEGDDVSYTIDVTNQYQSGGNQVDYTLYASTGSEENGWLLGLNAYDGTAADTDYATNKFGGSPDDTLFINGYSLASSGSINTVDVDIHLQKDGVFRNGGSGKIDLITFAVFYNAVEIYSSGALNAQTTIAAGISTYPIDITLARDWTTTDFALLEVQVIADKGSGSSGQGTLGIDQAEVNVSVNELPTLDPVPLTDTYNAAELEFVGVTGETEDVEYTHVVVGTEGTISWANIGPIITGTTESRTVNFTAKTLVDNQSLTTTDTASVTGATFSNGNPANDGSDDAETLIIPEGAIGDTIFFDVNQNGEQDANEPGIEDAVVELFLASDLVNPIDSALTDADGIYQFTGLDAEDYVVKVVTASTPLTGAVLTSDPDSDGEPCTGPLANGCDSETAVTLTQGQVYTGADFGYFLPGGVISGTLWIDFDDDGVVDASEVALPYITVNLYENDGVTLVATTETDADGNYSFGDLEDDTYRVKVDGADPDFPASIDQTYEVDSSTDEDVAGIVVSGGEVTGTYEGQGDAINFGYRYSGDNTLSGTIGLEDPDNSDGLMGSGTSGVDADEVAFENVTVYIYLWNDAGTSGVVESGETVLLGSTTTDANGDYSFSGLPEADGSGNDLYIVSTVPPVDNVVLNTTVSNTAATVLVNTTNAQGHSTGAYQGVPITQTTTNIDFAFSSVYDYDFGDLPASYGVLLPGGARHQQQVSPDLYFGVGVDAESNGVVSVSSEDDLFDDGVDLSTDWQNGSSGGSVDLEVTGSGWLVGYVDFNNDGDFLDDGELIVSQSASSGSLTLNFDVPTDTLDTAGTTQLYARFRLLDDEPFFPELAYTGESANGEVEDYLWAFNTISGSVYVDGGNDVFGGDDVEQAGVPISLYDGLTEIATTVTDSNGFYSFYGVPDGSYTVQMAVPVPAGSTALDDIDGGTLTTNGDVNPIVLATSSVSDQDFLLDSASGVEGAAQDISGTVFFDTVDDDDFTAGDTGRQGVEIEIYRDLDGSGTIEPNEFIGSTTTDANGDYTFTGLPSADYLIAMVNTSSVVAIKDFDGNTNGDNLIAVTLVTTDVIDQDFLTDSSSTPQICMMINGDSKDAMFMRLEVETATYEIEYVQALTNPTIWDGTVTLDGTNTTAVTNGDGTETVTITDIEALTNLGGGEGFFRLLRTENGQTLASSVNGWVDTDFGTTCRTYNNPFISCSLLTSTISAVSGQVITLLDTPALPAGPLYYIEITSGDLEGHRFDINTSSVNELTLESDSDLCALAAPLNTQTGAPSADLVGDSISIHEHQTLNSVYPIDQMTANTDQDFADQIMLWDDGIFVEYYLYEGTPNKWVLVGDAGLEDKGDLPLPPGHGSFVISQVAKTITAFGHVREYDFARPVCDGRNLMGGGYPLDQSATGRDYSKAAGFDGDTDFKLADQFLIWNGDNTPGLNGYNLYFYLDYSAAYLRWLVMGDTSLAPRDGEVLFLRDRAVMLESKNGLETYIQPLPWAP